MKTQSSLRLAPPAPVPSLLVLRLGSLAMLVLVLLPAAAYAQGGVPLWTNRYDGPGTGWDVVSAIAVDSGGNVFVTGYSANSASPPYERDFVTIAYSNAGVPLWTNRYAGSEYGYGSAIAVDNSGNVFVTGSSSNGSNPDYVTTKYSSSVSPLVHLDFRLLNNQLVLSWTNAGFNLQSAPDMTSTFTNLPGATSPYSNLLTGPQQFFRLKGD